MKRTSTLYFECVFLFALFFLSITVLKAQDPVFSGALAESVTADSRPGWIKIKPEAKLDRSAFLSLLNENANFATGNSFNLTSRKTDVLGITRYVYQEEHQGIPVENQLWILHENEEGLFLAQGNSLPTFENQAANASLSEEQALEVILKSIQSKGFAKYAWEVDALENNLQLVQGNESASYYPKGALVWVTDTTESRLMLAYKFDVYSVQPLARTRYFVHANNRKIIKTIDLMATGCFAEKDKHSTSNNSFKKEEQGTHVHFDTLGSGIANYVTANGGIVNFTTDFNGSNYTLNTSSLGPLGSQTVQTINANNEWDYATLSDFTDADNYWDTDPTAIGTQWGTEQVYDYYLTKHNRNSFDGNGSPLLSVIHFGVDYANAFWDGAQMTYGDGDESEYSALTSLDVIAHEITHGVTEHNGTGGLNYYYESGALNESFSDIFGVVFEFDRHPDGGDWLMGEDFDVVNQEGNRNIADPQLKGHPRTYHGLYWYDGFDDNRGVHWNSGVQNFWFYLLSTGGNGTNEYQYNYNVTGIGREKAAAISYRNLTTYLHPTATFEDAKDGAIQAAIDIYGNGSQEHLSTEEAWCAVGVGASCLPTINLVTPTLNEGLTAGTHYNITWTSDSAIISSVKIEYTNDTSANPVWTILEYNIANTGTYGWFVPNNPSTTARIRISDGGNTAIPRSGNPLIFSESQFFTITSCIGEQSFTASATPELNTSVDFTGNYTGDSYIWEVNGVVVDTSQHLTYNFTDYGVYIITYVIENNAANCINIETIAYSIIPDDVCEARLIDLNTAYRGTFFNATIETNEPIAPGSSCETSWCENELWGSVWYAFEASTASAVNIYAQGIFFSDTKIALYEGIDCMQSNPFQNAILLAANDDIPGNCCDGSLISIKCLTPGQIYYIQVDQFSPNQADFSIFVEEAQAISPDIDESFSNCVLPAGWVQIPGEDKFAGVFSDGANNECLGCYQTFWGGGVKSASYLELPTMDFSQAVAPILLFDYAHVPQSDSVNNELRVEVADSCGSYTSLLSISGTNVATNTPPTNSNGNFYVPTCEEIKQVSVELSSLAGKSAVSIRLVADGQWFNPIIFDNIILNEPNDTCRLLDSLVLVDIYNATNGPNWANTWDLSEPLDSFYGVTLNAFGCVVGLDLDGYIDPNCPNCWGGGNNLAGTLPASTWNLMELKQLSLISNNALTGSISPNVGTLIDLESLLLGYCQFTGLLPSEVGNLNKLTYLNLSGNQFSGTIPTTLANLTNLNVLQLGYNQFSALPDLGSLTNLWELNLGGNSFGGTIPSWMSNLTNLYFLDLSSNNWTGTIPAFLGNLTNLNSLYLGYNQLTGTLPNELSNLNFFYFTIAYNQLEGTIPAWLSNMTNLQGLYLSGNNFTGVVPDFSISASNLLDLEVNENRFTFEHILPNINANQTLISENANNSQYEDYLYTPQQKIGLVSSYLYVQGATYTFDLGIDAGIADNSYKWYKNGALIQTITGNNQLVIANVTTADIASYTCEVTNPNIPNLTLYSHAYSIVENIAANDNVCDAPLMQLDSSYTGTFQGTSIEANEPSPIGNNCETDWCDSQLYGSVWYSFVAPASKAVSIRTTGNDYSETKIALYSGLDCSGNMPFENAVLLAANDFIQDQCCSGSFINLACLNPGETYYIQVDQNSPTQGDFTIIVNTLESCILPCDLTLSYSNIFMESCPGSNNGAIDVFVYSPAGHTKNYELYDSSSNLLDVRSYGYFEPLSTGTYQIITRSTSDITCSLDLGTFTLVPGIDTIPPIAICPSETIDAAFVHAASGIPWGDANYTQEMSTVFNSNWHDFAYENLNPSLLFSDYYNFIYLEGSDGSANKMETFLGDNQQLVEDWVAAGNTLLLNAAPQGDEGDGMSFGFGGVQLNNSIFSDSAFAVNAAHPIFNGPNLPVATAYQGNSFGHAIICPIGMNATAILKSEDGNDLLVEAPWGNGKVFFGGMTASAFHQPDQEALNLKMNLLAYLKNNAIATQNSPIQLSLDENQQVMLNVDQVVLGALDVCELMDISIGKTTFNCDDLGMATVTITATDASFNTGSCIMNIEILDPNDYCVLEGECPSELTLNEKDMRQDTYQAGKITSAGTIKADTTVVFVAEESITLLTGFHAYPNSDFTASIGACEEVTTLSEREEEVAVVQRYLEIPEEIVAKDELQVRPNPFRETATVDFTLSKAQQIRLAVYSMEGKLMSTLVEGYLSEGVYSKRIFSEDLRGGIYVVLLQTEKEQLTRKIILIK